MLCTGGRAPLQYNRGAKDVFWTLSSTYKSRKFVTLGGYAMKRLRGCIYPVCKWFYWNYEHTKSNTHRRGLAELLVLRVGNARACTWDKQQKFLPRLFVSIRVKLLTLKQGEAVGISFKENIIYSLHKLMKHFWEFCKKITLNFGVQVTWLECPNRIVPCKCMISV